MKRNINKRSRKGRGALLLFLMVSAVTIAVYFCKDYQMEVRQEKKFEEIKKIQGNGSTPSILLARQNHDLLGFLSIPDTSFSYPVMQREGDSEYYLHRDFEGNYSFYGTPFLDARCRLDGDNLIIYGHNINGGRLFGFLQAYREEGFYNRHPSLVLVTGEGKRTYQIVSVVATDTSSLLYSFTDVFNGKEYRKMAGGILAQSLYRTEAGEELKKKMKLASDKEFFHSRQFIMLSTCRTGEGKDARLLVAGVRERGPDDAWKEP